MPLRKALYQVPDNKKVRLIIDTDIKCEADDHYAVAHAIMTPKCDVKAVLAEHFGKDFTGTSVADTANQSYEEAKKLIRLMNLEGEIPVLEGCTMQITDGQYDPSPASKFIIEEAMKDDDRPLFIFNQGALTNLATALLMKPEIADRMTAIWIGGGTYPKGNWEFNQCNDIAAVNVVMNSGIELWQVPENVYGLMKISIATLFDKVYPCGELGKYLVENVIEVSNYWAQIGLGGCMNPFLSEAAKRAAFPSGEVWGLGDSVCIGLLMNAHDGCYTMEGAPLVDPVTCQYILRPDNPNKIRLYNNVDNHFIIEDFLSKIHFYFGS